MRDLDAIRARYWERVRKKVTLAPGQRLVDKNPLNMTAAAVDSTAVSQCAHHSRDSPSLRRAAELLPAGLPRSGACILCRDLPTLAKAYSRAFGFWYSQWPVLRPFSYELRYEQLTADFDMEVRKLGEFLQLPWHEAMLEPGKHARAKGFISTPSYTQVLQPVNSKSVGRWHHYERHFTAQLPTLMPWLERWGYALRSPV